MILYISIGLNIFLVLLFINYRLQIKKICGQIAFIRKEKTNNILTSDLSYKELIKLTQEVNLMWERCKDLIKDYRIKDEVLKETITSISHDIRTPLTSIDGYLQLIKEINDEERREDYINNITISVVSLKSMLEELFLYSKLQDEEYKIKCEKENLTEILFSSITSFYQDFKNGGIKPQIDMISEEVYVSCNYGDMSRVFQNIVKNALVYSKSKVSMKYYIDGNKVIYICQNDCEDIESIDVNKVFDRFYKGDKSRNTKSTGLGLAISKSLVERFGGEIQVEIVKDNFQIKIIFNILP